jgi:hypothetical protein
VGCRQTGEGDVQHPEVLDNNQLANRKHALFVRYEGFRTACAGLLPLLMQNVICRTFFEEHGHVLGRHNPKDVNILGVPLRGWVVGPEKRNAMSPVGETGFPSTG